MKVVLGHPTTYAPGDISVGEAVITAHQALSLAQRILHREGEDLADEHRSLKLWLSMLKRMMVSERAAARARQHGFDLQVEAIAQHDANSWWALADVQELYKSVEAQASAVAKQEEDLVVRARQVNQWEPEVEKLDGLLQEREELDDITLRCELEALSTRETSLDHREADLEWEQKALEDACAQILARELNADAWDTGLRDQEARLAARERQLAKRQMKELVVAQKGLEDLQTSRAGDRQRVWSFLSQVDAALASFGFNPIQGGDTAPEADVVLPLLDLAGRKISQLEEAVGSCLEEEGRALAQAVANHVLMCFQSCDPSISLEPAVQGPIKGFAEVARDSIEEAARAIAERFERECEDA
jgi:hypothetical protein